MFGLCRIQDLARPRRVGKWFQYLIANIIPVDNVCLGYGVSATCCNSNFTDSKLDHQIRKKNQINGYYKMIESIDTTFDLLPIDAFDKFRNMRNNCSPYTYCNDRNTSINFEHFIALYLNAYLVSNFKF